MIVKEDLHHLVDQLDEEDVGELLDYARWLVAEEDDPLTEEEFARVHGGDAALATGDYLTLEQLRRQIRGE